MCYALWYDRVLSFETIYKALKTGLGYRNHNFFLYIIIFAF